MGWLDRWDRRNQGTLEAHNRQEKPLITKPAERILSWSTTSSGVTSGSSSSNAATSGTRTSSSGLGTAVGATRE